MFGKLKSWISAGAQDLHADDGQAHVPRYPPARRGYPVVTAQDIIDSQCTLVSRIAMSLGASSEQFDKMVRPALSAYAEYVHLLPASEAHHHSGQGGLFRHGLEVALYAVQGSESVIFERGSTPLERRNREPRWRIATLYAALLHDAGKTLSDMMVVTDDGLVWNPFEASLTSWLKDEGVKRYFVQWRTDRVHKQHEGFSLLLVERIVPLWGLRHLHEYGQVIVAGMVEAIGGRSMAGPIGQLVMRADGDSVSEDMARRGIVSEGVTTNAIDRQIFEAIRHLVRTGKWRVNEPGARVWHVKDEGVFVAFKQGYTDIAQRLAEQKVNGVPRDANLVADTLIERKYAISYESENGDVYRYWDIKPSLPNIAYQFPHIPALKLASLDLVFDGNPALPISASVGKSVVKGRDERLEPNQTITAEPCPVNVDDEPAEGEFESPREAEMPPTGEDQDISDPTASDVGDSTPLDVPPDTIDGIMEAANTEDQSKENCTALLKLTEEIETYGEAAPLLRAIIEPVMAREKVLGQELQKTHLGYALKFPLMSDVETRDGFQMLIAEKAIERDPILGTAVQVIEDQRFLVLSQSLSRAIESAIHALSEDGTTGQDSGNHKRSVLLKIPEPEEIQPGKADKDVLGLPLAGIEAKFSDIGIVSVEDVLVQLERMIRAGHGPWLQSPVKEEMGYLTVPLSILDQISNRYPGQLSKTKLRLALTHSSKWLVNKQKIWLKNTLGDGNEV